MKKLEGIIAPATTAFDASGKIDLNYEKLAVMALLLVGAQVKGIPLIVKSLEN